VHHRLRGLLQGLKRLLLVGLGLGALFLGWQAFLHYGPGLQGGPPMYAFHAKALVRARLAFPRPAPPVLVPSPQAMSSADVQLRLMKWRDGKAWLPEALAHGEAVKEGLRLDGGELVLGEVRIVEAQPAEAGRSGCRVRVAVRWELPEELQELLRVREIVGLRLPKGPGPGQTGELTCVLARRGWRWELVSADSPWEGKLPVGAGRPKPWSWLF